MKRLLVYVSTGAGVAVGAGWLAFFLWRSQQFTVGVSTDYIALRLTLALIIIGGVLGAMVLLLRR